MTSEFVQRMRRIDKWGSASYFVPNSCYQQHEIDNSVNGSCHRIALQRAKELRRIKYRGMPPHD